MVIQTLVLLDIFSKIKQENLLFQGSFLLPSFKVKIKNLNPNLNQNTTHNKLKAEVRIQLPLFSITFLGFILENVLFLFK